MYFWRSYLDPVWNHYIRGPVQIWSVAGGVDAIGDQQRYGMAKTVTLAAQAQGVDIGDPMTLVGFLNDVQAGQAVLDEDLVGRVLERQLGLPSPAQERKFAQLPVKLPAPEELTAAAGCSKVLG